MQRSRGVTITACSDDSADSFRVSGTEGGILERFRTERVLNVPTENWGLNRDTNLVVPSCCLLAPLVVGGGGFFSPTVTPAIRAPSKHARTSVCIYESMILVLKMKSQGAVQTRLAWLAACACGCCLAVCVIVGLF